MTRAEMIERWAMCLLKALKAKSPFDIAMAKNNLEEFLDYPPDQDTLIKRAVAAEREACASMVDHLLCEGGGTYGDAIRRRSE
jgi:hypothetical protein